MAHWSRSKWVRVASRVALWTTLVAGGLTGCDDETQPTQPTQPTGIDMTLVTTPGNGPGAPITFDVTVTNYGPRVLYTDDCCNPDIPAEALAPSGQTYALVRPLSCACPTVMTPLQQGHPLHETFTFAGLLYEPGGTEIEAAAGQYVVTFAFLATPDPPTNVMTRYEKIVTIDWTPASVQARSR